MPVPVEAQIVSVYFLYLLALFSGTTQFASQVTLSLYALKLGASPLWVGVLAGTFSLFPMLLAVAAGRLVDRFGSRWPMTVGATAGALGMLAPFVWPALPALFVAAALTGFASIFFNLSIQNLVGLLSKPEQRPRNFANYMLVTAVANLLGPLVAGFSIDHSDHARTCLVIALLALVSITMLLVRGGALPGGTRRPSKERSGGGGGARAMLRDPDVRRTLAAGMLINVGINLFQVYLPVYGHSVGLSASSIGIVLAMYSAAAFIVRFGLPWLLRRFGEQRLLGYCFYAGAAALALIPLFRDAVPLAMVAFLLGLGMGCGQPIVIMLMFSNSRDGRSGESLGLKFTTNQLTKLVSPVLFGALASGLGLLPMFLINAVLIASGGFFARPASDRSPGSSG